MTLNDKLKQSRADDVTMDCTKCKAHIKAETLKEVGEWLAKKVSFIDIRPLYPEEIEKLKRGEMP
jgi:hypothetical protein